LQFALVFKSSLIWCRELGVDYLTFALLFLLHANVDHFRTGWFVESGVSASLIVLIIRTQQPFFKSKPGTPLWIATLLVILVTVLLLYRAELAVRFASMPAESLLVLVGILVLVYPRGRNGEERFLSKSVFKLERNFHLLEFMVLRICTFMASVPDFGIHHV